MVRAAVILHNLTLCGRCGTVYGQYDPDSKAPLVCPNCPKREQPEAEAEKRPLLG